MNIHTSKMLWKTGCKTLNHLIVGQLEMNIDAPRETKLMSEVFVDLSCSFSIILPYRTVLKLQSLDLCYHFCRWLSNRPSTVHLVVTQATWTKALVIWHFVLLPSTYSILVHKNNTTETIISYFILSLTCDIFGHSISLSLPFLYCPCSRGNCWSVR